MSQETRTERDSMGEMQVPIDALYGASTARAVENFPIAHRPMRPAVIHAFGHLKAACAQANKDLGKLDPEIADAIIDAATQVAEGKHDAHFPVDVYQTGSGTSTNMNANEVIANLANQKLSGTSPERERAGSGDRSEPLADAQGSQGSEHKPRVHPNDHVNMGQSSNDTFPTAMHIAATAELWKLRESVDWLKRTLEQKARSYENVVKIGRTHLMDATPIRFSQVLDGFAAQMQRAFDLELAAEDALLSNMPIGGTAVGTGINTHPDFARRVCEHLSNHAIPGEAELFGVYEEAKNHVEAQASKDAFIDAHGHLKTIAVSLSKIANDIRHLGSGPRCGIGELILPAIQPGSSIMPGKVNPVICESVMQVVCRVIGNDATVTTAGLGGVGSIFELNVAMPVMIDAFLESVELLSNVCDVFVDKLLVGLEVDEKRCKQLIDESLMLVTALNPLIGYDEAAKVAKQAHAEGKTIRKIMAEKSYEGVTDAQLDEALDPRRMTEPQA
ncbi:MAG: class II fumarate hydratase [Planctomycetota bacterium]